MATFLLRGTYAKEAFQTLVDKPVDREKVFEEALGQCGMQMISWFYSPSDSGWISICEGTPEQLATVEIVGGVSGRNMSFTAELLLSGSELAESAKAAATIKI
tara:strand:+ start:109 stop:417 length:309 start_codon:yes stop_codon:yes gene_type:complete